MRITSHRPTWPGYFALVLFALGLFQLPALAAERPSDATVATYVKEALRHDERVDASQISVSVSRGIVKLAGDVSNLAEKNFADQEAKKINGVLGVVNELYVQPGWRSDIDISYAVERRILNSADIDSKGIVVAADKGKITLSGTVSTYSERQQAGILAAEAVGVTEVDNQLNQVGSHRAATRQSRTILSRQWVATFIRAVRT